MGALWAFGSCLCVLTSAYDTREGRSSFWELPQASNEWRRTHAVTNCHLYYLTKLSSQMQTSLSFVLYQVRKVLVNQTLVKDMASSKHHSVGMHWLKDRYTKRWFLFSYSSIQVYFFFDSCWNSVSQVCQLL